MARELSFTSHVADVRLKIKGDTIKELFEAGLEGMGKILNEGAYLEHKNEAFEEYIQLSSVDITSLLVDFLSRVLNLSYLNKVLYYHLDSFVISGNKLSVIVSGTRVKSFDEDIKAVTYHEAEVKRNNEGQWETTIIFDI